MGRSPGLRLVKFLPILTLSTVDLFEVFFTSIPFRGLSLQLREQLWFFTKFPFNCFCMLTETNLMRVKDREMKYQWVLM